ncbi:MAG: HalD/BesD family halogenase [Frankia sp.]
MSTSEAQVLDETVDAEHYPVSRPESDGWQRVVDRARRELNDSGCSVLRGFIRDSHLTTLRSECAATAPSAYYDVTTVNAYNIEIGTDLPADHPGRVTMRRGNAFVARDRLPEDLAIHRLYRSELFQRFIAGCFGLPAIHELADPLSGLCLNVITPGMEHPWHFDTNEFTVSLLTQEADVGGEFEYCPGIRSAHTENFGDVRDVLAGGRPDRVHRLTLRPGDLQLFKGRYSMHRVSEVRGATARHSAVFAYSEQRGVVGSVARTRQLFGRVLPAHRASHRNASRVDQLLD